MVFSAWLVQTVIGVLSSRFVLSKYWEWFVVPVFAVIPIGIGRVSDKPMALPIPLGITANTGTTNHSQYLDKTNPELSTPITVWTSHAEKTMVQFRPGVRRRKPSAASPE